MSVTPLITAAEGFPAFERLAASAREDLFLSFRVLDPKTRLREPELVERGLETWADLLAWVSRRGVRIRLLVADFDPLYASDMHRRAWVNASGFAEVLEGDTQVMCAPHGQKAGWLWRLILRSKIQRRLKALRAEDPTNLTPVQRLLLRDGPILRPVTVHQKIAIADGRACIVGGLDINERRYDTPLHNRAADQTWHDVSMQIVDTDFSQALKGHFAECWNAAIDCGTTSLANRVERIDTTVRAQSRSDLRLVRTLTVPRAGATRLAPSPKYLEHETTLIRLFSEAKDYVYVETQYLRHAPLVDALCQAVKKTPDLQLILLVPAAPDRVMFDGDDSLDARHGQGLQVAALEKLRLAFGENFVALSPAQPRPAKQDEPEVGQAAPVYLHSKVTVVDDRFALVGSANLNGRSMKWDSEASVLVSDPDVVGGLLDRLAEKWLGPDANRDVSRADTWRRVAEAQSDLMPENRTAFVVPYPLHEAQSFGKLLWVLPDDMF